MYSRTINTKGWIAFLSVTAFCVAVGIMICLRVIGLVEALLGINLHGELQPSSLAQVTSAIVLEFCVYYWLNNTPLGDFLLGDVSGGMVLALRRNKVRLRSFRSEQYRMGAHDILSWGGPRVW